jgi:UDP-N-acetylmuramoyl-tripeptide--D-alanyl-D-alanine ligase
MTSPLWTWDALVAAADAQADGTPAAAITGFSIDTRAIHPGEVFVALTDTRDGHDFVSAAFKAGAAAALVSRTYSRRDGDGALLRVEEPLRGLERIGIAARKRLAPDAVVIAVTGSAGKTGTKDMLRACLAPVGKTHAPEKSFNNHWGVPLTLARMPADVDYAVIEIGMNHAGEITPLTKMTRPHIAIITNVLPVHIGNFPDGEFGVANAKAEIFSGLEPGGIAILPRDTPHFERLAAAAALFGLDVSTQVTSFGEHANSMVQAEAITAHPDRSTVTVALPTASITPEPMQFDVGVPGRHIAVNAVGVMATLMAAVDWPGHWADIMRPVAAIMAPAGRGARSTIARATGGSMLLIDESYNANPASMRAALANLALVPRDQHPRRIVVLGDMRELGADAPKLHRDLTDAVVATGADQIFLCGEHMQNLAQNLAASFDQSRVHWGPTSATLAPQVAASLRAGDVVMIKGSLGTNMAPIVAAVRGLSEA